MLLYKNPIDVGKERRTFKIRVKVKNFNMCDYKSLMSIGVTIMITRRYDPLRGPTSSSCGGLRPSAEAFFALGAKKELFMLFWPIFGDFWCPVVTVVTFSSNLSN